MRFPQTAQPEAVHTLASLGFSRILTHGGLAGTPINQNLGHLQELVDCAGEDIIILPGAGITWENAEDVANALGVHEVHGTKIVAPGVIGGLLGSGEPGLRCA